MAEQGSKQKLSASSAKDYTLNHTLHCLLLYQMLILFNTVTALLEINPQQQQQNPNHGQCYTQEDLYHNSICHWNQPKCPNIGEQLEKCSIFKQLTILCH